MKMKFALCIVICLAVTKVVKGTESVVRDRCSVNKSRVPLCSQLCLKSAEQYTCSCMTGYVLADDNKTCLISGEEPRLVYVSGKEVSVYFTETGDIEPLTELPNSHVTDLGFGPDDSVLLVSDHGTVVYRTSLDDGNTRGEPVPLVDTGLKSVTSVAVDWVTHNIYLVDNEAGTIIVCTWKADNCSVLIRDLQRPHSVVLNIRSRKLLWTEWGMKDQAGSIKTADLDGSQVSLLLDSLNGPRNLFLDTTVGELYWVATTQSGYIIQSLKLNSEHRKVSVISNGITFPSVSGVSVLSDQLYVTGSIGTVVINKFTGQLLGNESLDTGSITVAAVYHRVLYDTQDIADPCGSSPCCHMCVPSNSNHGYRCLCPVDMELDTEGKCTRRKDVERLLVSGMTGIYDIPKEFIGNHDYRGQRLLEAEVNCVVYDSIEEAVFYYDDSARAIQMIWLQNPQKPSLLYKPMSAVEGMAHDPSSHNIYWTTTKGKVYVGKVDGTFSTEIIAGLDRPRGITVDTENGYLYMCDWGRHPQIVRCHMDGTHCATFIHVDRGHPNMVAIASPLTAVSESHYRNKALYWTDSKQDMIGYTSLEGDGVGNGYKILIHSENPHPYSLVVTDSTIYFTDLNTRHVHYIEKSHLTTMKDLHLSMGSLYGMDHVCKSSHVPETACSVHNGGCTHMCLVKPGGQRSCLCPDSEGNTTCTVEQKELPANKTKVTYNKRPRQVEKKDSMLLLVVLLVTGVVILMVVILSIVFCYHRNKQRKQTWMLRFVSYMKKKQTDDAEGLVAGSTLSLTDPNFQQFDNIDYPEEEFCIRSFEGRHDGRETSMISTDSAFNEMKDFDTYSSIDNL